MSDFDGLTVVISGPLVELARFQPLLEALVGELSLRLGQGADDGKVGILRWSGQSAVPPRFAVRGPRSPRRMR